MSWLFRPVDSLRNGLTAYAALSSETNSSCLRRWRISGSRKPGRTSQTSAQLDTSHGCQDHTPLPSATSSRHSFDRLMCCRPRFWRRRLSAGRLRAVRSLTGRSSPCEHVARPTLPRPSHPAPNVRDDRDTPLSWARDGGLVGVIWGKREAEYFCAQHWTNPMRDVPDRQRDR